MPESTIVPIGEYRISQAPSRLVTYGIGSCAGIAVYDAATGRGALAHTLLPFFPGEPSPRTAKFTDAAIQMMLEELIKSGCDSGTLVAKLAGGAAMFDHLYRNGQMGIGERNIEAARISLSNLSIPVVAEDVGGTTGRSMIFDLANGEITIRTLSQHATRL